MLPAKYKTLLLLLVLAGSASVLILLSVYFRGPYTTFSGLHSSVFYTACFLILTTATELAILPFIKHKETQTGIRVLYVAVFLTLILAEITLRSLHINETYPEARNGRYYSPFNESGKSFERTRYVGLDYLLQSPEFSFARKANNFGYSDYDFAPKLNSDSLLIQTYGDSFTEGDGAAFDSSYPAQLRKLLPPRTTVQNFGLCGNDPGFYLYQLKDCGAQFKPDIAVMCYGTGDYIVDFFCRGGLDRFKQGLWKARNGKNWEWIYAASYISRPFFQYFFKTDYGKFLFSEQEFNTQLKKLEPEWNKMFVSVIEEARKNNIQVLLIKKPERSEVNLNHYDYDFTFFENMADTLSGVKRIDLLPYYRDSAHIHDSNSGLYYWPKDNHHNASGYGIMARAVYTALAMSYPVLFALKNPSADAGIYRFKNDGITEATAEDRRSNGELTSDKTGSVK